MADYAVVNPATGETVKEYPTISDGDLKDAIGRAYTANQEWMPTTTVAERARADPQGRGAAHGQAPGAGRDHRPRDGQADRAGARRGRLLRGDLRVLRRQRREAARRRADRPAGGRRLGADPPQLVRRAARDHAVELPVLPGGAVRRTQPGDRQHDPAQARAAVPGVGGGDGADLPRGGVPRGRVHQHLRDQRPDRVGDRGSARPRRVADGLRARRRRRRRDRRAQPQEGRAGARRLRSVHPAVDRRSRRARSRRPSPAGWRTPARPATRPSG